MIRVWYLSTCDTCRRILKSLPAFPPEALQDIKTEPVTPAQLDDLAARAGSYESLFSRSARKYKEMGLKDVPLTESDFRRLILEDYTFLRRPVFRIGEQVFAGNQEKTLQQVATALQD